jgi:hypothetical protein
MFKNKDIRYSVSGSLSLNQGFFSLCLCISAVIFPSLCAAAGYTTYTTVQIPYPLEDRGHCPRAMALGSAFTAVEGDATCLYWNPAGLNKLEMPEISLTHQSWYSDITQETFLCAMPISNVGAFALGANYQSFGNLDGYNAGGDPTASFRPYRASISLGQGMALSPAFSVGLSVREFSQTLIPGGRTASYSVCPGLLWHALPTLRFGAFYSFLNTDASWELGLLKVGASWKIPLLEKYPCLLLFDLSMPPHGVYQIQCGAEQELFSVFFIRLGFQQDLKDNQIDGFRGFTEGLGIKFKGFDLDYSCALNGDLGCAQMVGLTYHFQPEKEDKTPPQPSSEPLVFKPPSEIKPQDKVVKVELQFQLPPPDTAPSSEVKVISPEIQGALDEADKKVQKSPKDPVAWLTLGKLYFQLGRSEYTIQCFEEALRIQPDNLQLKTWLEQYRRQLKKPASKPE